MLITTQSARKLFKKNLIETEPLIVKESQQAEVLESIKTMLKKNQNTVCWREETNQYSGYHQEGNRLKLRYDYGEGYGESNTITLKFKKEQLFIVLDYHTENIVYKPEQLCSLLVDLKHAMDKQFGLYVKKRKIKQLKHRAINAKIQALAKAEQFDYYLQEYKTKVKLIVRMDNKILEVDVPYGKFQTVLKELQDFIRTFKSLQQSGITFRFKTVQAHRSYNWIRHEEI